MKRIIETTHEYITVKLWFIKKEKKKEIEIEYDKSNRNLKL